MPSFNSQPAVSGTFLLARLLFLRKQGGSALKRVLDELPPSDAAVLRHRIRPESWYHTDLPRHLDDAIVSAFPQDDRADLLIQIGRASADALLGPNGRPIALDDGHIEAGTAKAFMACVERLYAGPHTVGRREYQQLGNNAAVIRRFPGDRLEKRDLCWTVVGCLQRALELSGAEAALVTEVACSAGGSPCCEYHCEWERSQT